MNVIAYGITPAVVAGQQHQQPFTFGAGGGGGPNQPYQRFVTANHFSLNGDPIDVPFASPLTLPVYGDSFAEKETMNGNAPATQGAQAQPITSISTVYVTVTSNASGSSSQAPFTQPSSSYAVSTLTQTYTSLVLPSASPVPTATYISANPTESYTANSAIPTQSASAALGTPTASSGAVQDQGRTGGLTHPNSEQLKTIWVAAVMFVCIMLGWNMVLLRDVLYPWKMWVNAIHEGCHIFVGTLTGAKIISVTIDPDKGPISGMTEGQPLLTLLAGYTGSVLIGSALIMCAFDTSASKVAALCVYPMLLICFWFGRTWARLRVLVCMGVSIAFFFIDHASALRYYILFIGVMNAFYVVWDVIDDRVFRKANESDVALLARMSKPTINLWILLCFTFTLACVSLAIIGGLHFFAKSAEAQRQAQHSFLWT